MASERFLREATGPLFRDYVRNKGLGAEYFEIVDGLATLLDDMARKRTELPPEWSCSDVVYFINCGTSVKIGRTRDLSGRVAALQTSTPMELMVWWFFPPPIGTIEAERRIHQALRYYRQRGEWFNVDGGLAQLLLAFRSAWEG